MQMLVWYPAAAANGKHVTFEDYLSTRATEDDFTLDEAAVKRITARRIADNQAAFPLTTKVLARPMWAMRDAPEKNGKFPVVIYAPSYSAAASENPDLCEYLASHGYIVIASASQGTQTRAMTTDIDGVEAQASDIGYLISHAATMKHADMGQIAVAGFSWGGLANVVAAARDDRIKALVALDGSVRSYPHMVDGGKDAIRYVSPARLAIPLIFFAKQPATLESLNFSGANISYNLLNKMVYSDVMIATMHPMKHGHFASDNLRFLGDADFGEYTRDEVTAAYGWVSRYVLRFLDAYLKQDAGAMAFLEKKPVANGVPPHMMSMDMRHAKSTPLNRAAFATQLAERGFGQAHAIYKEMQDKGANFTLDADAINNWGYQLLLMGKQKESIAIFQFGTQLIPTDANLFDSLGEAQAAAGMREEAVRNYQRSLELNPKNSNAVERLKALKAG